MAAKKTIEQVTPDYSDRPSFSESHVGEQFSFSAFLAQHGGDVHVRRNVRNTDGRTVFTLNFKDGVVAIMSQKLSAMIKEKLALKKPVRLQTSDLAIQEYRDPEDDSIHGFSCFTRGGEEVSAKDLQFI